MSTESGQFWIAEVDDVQTEFPTAEALVAHLAALEQEASGHLWVLTDRGPTKGWRRFFGPKRDVTPCFTVEWDTGFASLIFLDDSWSEYRAIDSGQPVSPSEEIRLRISHGEPTPHPTEQCMDKARAFAAMREFIASGDRPDWLTYKHVG